MLTISPFKIVSQGYMKHPQSEIQHTFNTYKNNFMLPKDTVSFSGANKKGNKNADEYLGINAGKYHPFEAQVRQAEKSRRKLQYDADLLGIKLRLPEQEDFAEAIAVKSELRRGEAKVKQAMRNGLDAKKAERLSRMISDLIGQDKKEKSQMTLAQYDEAKRIFDEGVLDIKINALLEIVGEDKKDRINRDALRKVEQSNRGLDNDELISVIADILGVDALSDYYVVYNKAEAYETRKAIRLLGIKTPEPSKDEIWREIAKYEEGLLERKIVTKTELMDMQY